MAYDSSKPVTSGALVAADIRENFRALKDDVIVNAANADNADNSDKVDGFHASQTPGANLCAVADANGKLPVGWLKFAEGSWDITMSGESSASVQLTAYSHWPQTCSNTTNAIINFGSGGVYLSTTYSYQFWAQNTSATSGYHWLGIYDYHAASEQIVEVYYDTKGKIIGIHVAEKGNENSAEFYDPKLEKIIPSKKVFTKIDIPEFFEEGICKYRAEILFGDEKKKNLIKQKITKLVKVQKNAS